MELIDLISAVRTEMVAVEEEIVRLTDSPTQIVRAVATHTMGAGGKRLRPFLTLLSAKASGTITPQVITLAGLIEMAHTAALIHDDVIDEAETRRGQRTANLLWGNSATVLVGDFFISQIILILSRDEFRNVQPFVAAAANRMCVGQIMEIEKRRKTDMSEAEYKELIQFKTAELVSAACYVGVIGAGGDEETALTLSQYGMNIGLAFQIVDDLLDITSNGNKLGKPIGNDLREGKITLPYIRTLAVAENGDREKLTEFLSLPTPSEEVIRQATGLVHSYDGIAYSKQIAHGYALAAQRSLETLRDSDTKYLLNSVAEFVLMRDM
jgi:geranylgeranyl pyrophosphate synthase